SSFDSGTYIVEQAIQSRHEMQRQGATRSAHPDDILEEKVDSLKFSLDELARRQPWSTTAGGERLRAVELSLLLGAYYRTLVDLWNECLWNGWRLRSIEQFDLISPSGKPEDIVRAASRFRDDALTLQFVTHMPAIVNSMTINFRDVLIPKRLRAIQGSGKHRRLAFENNAFEATEFPDSFMFRFLALDRYFPDLMHRAFPSDEELSLKLVLDAWEALFWAGRVLMRRMPADSTVFKAEKLYEYAPTFTMSELIDIV